MTHALTSTGADASEDGTGRGTPLTAFHPGGGGSKGLAPTDDLAPGTGTGKGGAVAVSSSVGVRRLTPTECERLQALPDGWTDPDGTASDSRRYSAIGDAVTASVAEWIGRRIIDASAAGRLARRAS